MPTVRKGFLSAYSQVDTVDLGGGFWCKVRRYLTRGEFKQAQAMLVSPMLRSTGDETETTGAIDSGAYQDELVFRAIESWNLTDEDGVDLPLAPEADRRASIARLPEEVFEAIIVHIEGATAVKKGGEDDAITSFPEVGDGGAVGESGPADGADPVPAGAGVLEGVGANS